MAKKRAERLQKRNHNLSLKIAREYLAKLMIHAHQWNSFHSKKSVLKGTVDCPQGGWKKLLEELVSEQCRGIPEKCTLCQEILTSAGFNFASFQDALRQALVAKVPDSGDEPEDEQPEADLACLADGLMIEDDEDAAEAGVADDTPEGIKAVHNDPDLELLPRDTFRCVFPVKCLLCRNKKGKQKVFDLCNPSRLKYVNQHVNGPTHVKNLARRQTARNGDDPSPCQGFCPERSLGTNLHRLLKEYQLWASYNTSDQISHMVDVDSRHSYQWDNTKKEHTIFHQKCEKVASALLELDSQRQPDHLRQNLMCNRCRSLGENPSLRRMVSKFFVKHAAARCLPYHGVTQVIGA